MTSTTSGAMRASVEVRRAPPDEVDQFAIETRLRTCRSSPNMDVTNSLRRSSRNQKGGVGSAFAETTADRRSLGGGWSDPTMSHGRN